LKAAHENMARPLKKQVDERLARLYESRQPGQAYTLGEIARACGCTRQAVQSMERSALHHAREVMRRKLGMGYGEFSRSSASEI
jgi:hypothetical protein